MKLSLFITSLISIVAASKFDGDLSNHIAKGKQFQINGCITQSTENTSRGKHVFLRLSSTPLVSCQTSFVIANGRLRFRDASGGLKPLFITDYLEYVKRVGGKCPDGSKPVNTGSIWCAFYRTALCTSETSTRIDSEMFASQDEKSKIIIKSKEGPQFISFRTNQLVNSGTDLGFNLNLFCLKNGKYQKCMD